MTSSSGSGRAMLAVGLWIGLVIGAGGMYLALEKPWASAPAKAAAPPDAGPAVAEPSSGKKKPKKRRGGGGAREQRFEPDPTIVLGAADVAMSWKGDAVERPPAQLDMGTGGEDARSLDQGEINATIASDGGALQDCVVDAVGAAPFDGEITVKMLVDGGGRVTKVRVHAPAFMHAEGLLSCARSAARRMGYPAVGGYTVVTIPFPISTR